MNVKCEYIYIPIIIMNKQYSYGENKAIELWNLTHLREVDKVVSCQTHYAEM